MNDSPMQRAADVLLVAGNYDDVSQIRHTLRRAKVQNRLHHVGNEAEAKAYLQRQGPYMRAPSPSLIMVDASLPRASVIDLITFLKTGTAFAEIAVIVLVGSESDRSLVENCLHAVDGSIQMPFNLAEFAKTLVSVDTFSFLLVQSTPAM